MLKKTVQQGRSKRRGEAYASVPLREVRTPLADFFSILLGIGSGSRQPCLLRESQHEVHGLNGLACGALH